MSHRLQISLAAPHLEGAACAQIGLSSGLNSSDFAMNRSWRCGKSGIPSGQGSKFDV